MIKLIRAEYKKRIYSLFFFLAFAILLFYNIWDISLSYFDFDIGWTYFLFQKLPHIMLFVCIDTSLKISQDLCGKTINNKLYMGYKKTEYYLSQIITGIIEGLALFFIDTIVIILLCIGNNYTLDVRISTLLINTLIIMFMLSVISIIATVCAFNIPNRIINLVVIAALSLILFQKGDDATLALIQPKETIYFNDSVDEVPIENPLYISGNKRLLYNLELAVSPYAQTQYAKYILFEYEEQKNDCSLFAKNYHYHIDFIIIDIITVICLYWIGFGVFKRRDLV